jgi:excisionase family DNA binding protein
MLALSRIMAEGAAPTNTNDRDLLTIPEVAKRLSVSEYRAYELARKGILKSVRLGRSVRVKPSAVAVYLSRHGA